MAEASRQQDDGMEDLLASIRRIIARDVPMDVPDERARAAAPPEVPDFEDIADRLARSNLKPDRLPELVEESIREAFETTSPADTGTALGERLAPRKATPLADPARRPASAGSPQLAAKPVDAAAMSARSPTGEELSDPAPIKGAPAACEPRAASATSSPQRAIRAFRSVTEGGEEGTIAAWAPTRRHQHQHSAGFRSMIAAAVAPEADDAEPEARPEASCAAGEETASIGETRPKHEPHRSPVDGRSWASASRRPLELPRTPQPTRPADPVGRLDRSRDAETRPTLGQRATQRLARVDAPERRARADEPRRIAEPDLSERANESILSGRTEGNLGEAFDTLSRTVGTTSPCTVEDLVRETMRPLLREWMDRNLADIVERIVRQEVDRVVSRGR